jgi:spore coat protein U-like protein
LFLAHPLLVIGPVAVQIQTIPGESREKERRREEMKKLLVVTIVIAMMVFAVSAMAVGSANLTVQATVSAGCGINSTTPVSFIIDPGSSVNATATGGANVWCANTITGTVAITGNGLNSGGGPNKYMLSPSTTATILYTLDIPNPIAPGLGRATPIVVPIIGTVAVADFTNAPPAADYEDTVTVTITP